jgi:hypothetical protein
LSLGVIGDGQPLHSVGSLAPSDHPDLLAISKHRYKTVDREAFPGLVAFETAKIVFGKQRRFIRAVSSGVQSWMPGAVWSWE